LFFAKLRKKSTAPLPSHGKDDARDSDRHSGAPAKVPTFREIFEQHGRFLWRTLWGLGVPAADIEDLCQEVFLVVHRRLPTFDGQSVRGWLYAIAVRVASDHRRRAHVRRETVSDAAARIAVPASQPEALERSRMQEQLLAVLDRLDGKQRAAFVLYEIEELTLREIAEALGCPLQTAYSRVQAAKRAVNQAFAERGLRR
jgi:RNA polymerase sigma-70 factor (ECF subfamily)